MKRLSILCSAVYLAAAFYCTSLAAAESSKAAAPKSMKLGPPNVGDSYCLRNELLIREVSVPPVWKTCSPVTLTKFPQPSAACAAAKLGNVVLDDDTMILAEKKGMLWLQMTHKGDPNPYFNQPSSTGGSGHSEWLFFTDDQKLDVFVLLHDDSPAVGHNNNPLNKKTYRVEVFPYSSPITGSSIYSSCDGERPDRLSNWHSWQGQTSCAEKKGETVHTMQGGGGTGEDHPPGATATADPYCQ